MGPPIQLGVHCKDEATLQALKNMKLSLGESEVKCISLVDFPQPPRFSVQTYESTLKTKHLGRPLLVAATIPSTQTLLHQNISSLPDGAICVTDIQTAGKGRGSNLWTSPMGCLMFSAYKRLNISGQHLPFVQYVASLAIVHAIQKACNPTNAALDIRIKWPNDIYANHLKIGGILCQSVYRDGAFHVVLGAGLNVNNAEPTTCLASLVRDMNSASGASNEEVSREVLLARIAEGLEDYLQILGEKGFGPLKQLYLEAWLHTGQKVILEELNDNCLQSIPLTIAGISDSGYLTASNEAKEMYELHPDGNSLDFFAGLVRHKALPTPSR